jgi:hypothetical protein
MFVTKLNPKTHDHLGDDRSRAFANGNGGKTVPCVNPTANKAAQN